MSPFLPLVKGHEQTGGNTAETHLQIQASWEGGDPVLSSKFAVCAHPKDWVWSIDRLMDPDIHQPTGKLLWGVLYESTVPDGMSDSGEIDDLDAPGVGLPQIIWVEDVREIYRTGFFTEYGLQVGTTEFLTTTTPPIDTRAFSGTVPAIAANYAKHHNEGWVKLSQHIVFDCLRCGAKDAPVPGSGFHMSSRITMNQNGDNVIHVLRVPASVDGVGGGVMSGADQAEQDIVIK